VAAFSYQIDHCPVFFATLQMRELQIGQFPPTQATAEQYSENRAVSFALHAVRFGGLPRKAGLIRCEPISQPDTQFLHAF
jgi:hypothetical protein